MKQGTAIIIGAGPAGLTAAIELQRNSAIKPILIEASHEIGGISRTVRLQGQPHGHRRPPLLFEVGPRDALVAGTDAGGGRRRR